MSSMLALTTSADRISRSISSRPRPGVPTTSGQTFRSAKIVTPRLRCLAAVRRIRPEPGETQPASEPMYSTVVVAGM